MTTTFKNSGFFARPRPGAPKDLPTPAQVASKAGLKLPSTDPYAFTRPAPVKYPEWGLLVKFGDRLDILEGQIQHEVYELLHPHVPVPEVYGWNQVGKVVFIYMQLIDGVNLWDAWPHLNVQQKGEISQQLKGMLQYWRTIKSPAGKTFVGNVLGGGVHDPAFVIGQCVPQSSFPTVKAFNDWFTSVKWPKNRGPHPDRNKLPDTEPPIFTFGDYQPSNFLVTTGPQARVTGVIDWPQSGFMPAYWEHSIASNRRVPGEDWSHYLNYIMEHCPYVPEVTEFTNLISGGVL